MDEKQVEFKRLSWSKARTEYRKGNKVYADVGNKMVEMLPYKGWGLVRYAFMFEASRITDEYKSKRLKYYIK